MEIAYALVGYLPLAISASLRFRLRLRLAFRSVPGFEGELPVIGFVGGEQVVVERPGAP